MYDWVGTDMHNMLSEAFKSPRRLSKGFQVCHAKQTDFTVCRPALIRIIILMSVILRQSMNVLIHSTLTTEWCPTSNSAHS